MSSASSSPLPCDSTALSFRQLTASDAEDFRDLRLAAIAEHPEFFGTPYNEEAAGGLELFRQRIRGRQDGEAVFGVFRGNEMVGIAAMFRYSTSGTMRHRGELWGVYVRPEMRGSKAAEGLIGTVVAHARRHVDVLTGHVTTTNPRARAFYERLGFQFTGVETKILKVNGRYFDQEILAMDFTGKA